MLMPTLSVTAIGVIGPLIFARTQRPLSAMTLGLGLIGAWIGFVAGAIVGVTIDAVAQTGGYLALLGHLGAVVGTVIATRLDRRATRTG